MPRAVVYDGFGGPEVLHSVDSAEVHARQEGTIRLRVRAVGLNSFDRKQRSGLIPNPEPRFPAAICSDVAGVVDEIVGVPRYHDGTPASLGDEVLGWSDRQDALREQLVVPASTVTLKPPGLSWASAGSLMTPALTANAAIETLQIGADDTVLLSAAAGGVGVVYAQLAIARGATVIGTASVGNHAFLRSIGVIPLEYGADLARRVRQNAPAAVTAVQDDHGRETIDAGLELGVAPSRICSIVEHRAVAELGLASPGRYERSAAALATLADSVAAGAIALPEERLFAFTDTVSAFRLLEGGHGIGRIVVAVG